MASQSGLQYIQFAVGGQILPPENQWIKISERLRGRAVRRLCQILTGDSNSGYAFLPEDEKQKLSLISGKDGRGKPLAGHPHGYFLVWPDENGYPTRLIVWRRVSFNEQEITALVSAAERPITWEEKESWTVYLVPLPSEMPLPRQFCGASHVWESVTRFVPPVGRHRFRSGGRLRRGEATEEAARRLVSALGMPAPVSVSIRPDQQVCWTRLHETRAARLGRQKRERPLLRPGFRLLLEFDRPVRGPIIVGDSCHFGLGLFAASGSR